MVMETQIHDYILILEKSNESSKFDPVGRIKYEMINVMLDIIYFI